MATNKVVYSGRTLKMVDDDTELAAVGKIFSELIEDADIEYERE